MKKSVLFVFVLLLGKGMLFAQELSHMQMDHEHPMPFVKPDEWIANTIVWTSVSVVIITLVWTLKYLIYPGEKNPNHIKNLILQDENF